MKVFCRLARIEFNTVLGLRRNAWTSQKGSPWPEQDEKEGMRPETNPNTYHYSSALTIRYSPHLSPQFTRSNGISRRPLYAARAVDQMADRYLRREAKLGGQFQGIALIRTTSRSIRESHSETGGFNDSR